MLNFLVDTPSSDYWRIPCGWCEALRCLCITCVSPGLLAMPCRCSPSSQAKTPTRGRQIFCHEISEHRYLEKEENYFCILKYEHLSVNSSQSPLRRTGQWPLWHSSAEGDTEVVGDVTGAPGTSASGAACRPAAEFHVPPQWQGLFASTQK